MIPALIAAAMLHTAAVPTDPHAPFAVGERLEYGGKWSGWPFEVGGATMTVLGIDSSLRAPAWHFRLTTEVNAAVYKTRDTLESWTTVADFRSRRFVHFVQENGKVLANDDFRIHPDSGFFRNRHDTITAPTVAAPLDDLAFIYFIRLQSLELGRTFQYPNYFKRDQNPLLLHVVGKEWMVMPDGSRRRCWVVNPVMDQPKSMFSPKADARLWITDDGLRLPVQIRAGIGVGSVTLHLKSISHTG